MRIRNFIFSAGFIISFIAEVQAGCTFSVKNQPFAPEAISLNPPVKIYDRRGQPCELVAKHAYNDWYELRYPNGDPVKVYDENFAYPIPASDITNEIYYLFGDPKRRPWKKIGTFNHGKLVIRSTLDQATRVVRRGQLVRATRARMVSGSTRNGDSEAKKLHGLVDTLITAAIAVELKDGRFIQRAFSGLRAVDGFHIDEEVQLLKDGKLRPVTITEFQVFNDGEIADIGVTLSDRSASRLENLVSTSDEFEPEGIELNQEIKSPAFGKGTVLGWYLDGSIAAFFPSSNSVMKIVPGKFETL